MGHRFYRNDGKLFQWRLLVLTLLFATMWTMGARAQTTVTIGTGTSTVSTVPIYGLYGYSYSQILYTATDITGGGWAGGAATITNIRFYLNTAPATPANDNSWTVYLGNTSLTSLTAGAANYVPTSAMTQCFSGTVTFPAGGNWMDITLSTPFSYSGGNLLIAVDENAAGYSSASWRYTAATGMSRYLYSDTYNPDPAALPGSYSGSSGSTANRPNLQMVMVAAPACSGTPNGGTATAGTYNFCGSGSTLLSVSGSTSGVTGLSYQWQSGPSATGPWTSISGATNATYTTPTLTTTTYYQRLISCTNSGLSNVSDTTVVNINTVAFPTVGISPVSPVTYCGITPVSLTASGASSYTWSPATGLNASNTASVNASPSATTVYTVTGTSASGCTATSTIEVIAGVGFTSLTASATPPTICSGATSVLTANATLPSSYCSAAATSTSFEKIGNVTLNTINNTTTATAGYEDQTAVSTTLAAGTAYPLSLTITAAYATDDQVRIWVDMDQNGTFSDPAELVYSDAVSTYCPTCSGTTTVMNGGSITIPNTATNGATRMRIRLDDASSSTNNQTPCGNGTFGQVEDYTVIITGGQPSVGITYSWSPTTFLNNNTGSTVNAVNVTATTVYTVTAQAPNGCVATQSTTVTIGTASAPTVAPTTSAAQVCPNTTITLNAGATGGCPPLSYSWSDGSTTVYPSTNSINVVPGATTIYTVVVTDASSATASGTVSVTWNPSPSVNITPLNPTICSSEPITLTANSTGADTWIWPDVTGTPGSTTVPFDVLAQPVESNSSTSPSLVASASVPALPYGAVVTSITLTYNGIEALGSSWMSDVRLGFTGIFSAPPQAGSTNNFAGVFNYSATWTGAILINPGTLNLVYWDLVSDNTGAEATFPVGTGVASLTINYNLPASGMTFTPTPTATTTTYAVIASNSVTGCTATATTTVTISEPVIPVPTTAFTDVCQGGSTTLGVATTPTGTYSYVWTSDNVNVTFDNANSATPVASNITATTIFTVVATNTATNCVGSGTVTVTVDPLAVGIDLSASATTLCEGASLTLSSLGSGGGQPYTYHWYDGATEIFSGASNTYTFQPAPGSHNYSVVITDVCSPQGSVTSSSIAVTVNPAPGASVDVVSATRCGNSIAITASATSGTGLIYAWAPAAGLNAVNVATVNATPSSSTIYTVTITEGTNFCSSTATSSITVGNPLSASVTADETSGCSPFNTALHACTSGQSTATATFTGSPWTSTGPSTTFSTITVPAIPGGATLDSAVLVLNSVQAVGSSWRSEFRVALTGDYTLAATQVSTTQSSGLITPDPRVVLAGWPSAGGSVNLLFSESFDDTGDDATVQGASIVVYYTQSCVTPTGVTFSWTPSTGLSSTTSANPNVSLTASGSPNVVVYQVTATNGLCSSTATITLTANPQAPAPTISNVGALSFCPGSSVTLNSSSATDNAWTVTTTPGGAVQNFTTASIVVDSTSSVSLIVSDAFCPSVPATINALRYDTLNPVINIDGGGTAICTGDRTLTVIDGSGYTYGNYQWSTSSTDASITITDPGTYTVTAEDQNGCAVSQEATFTAGVTPPAPVISTASPEFVCNNTLVSLTSDVAPVSGNGTSITWSVTSDNTPTTSTNLSPPGLYDFYVTYDSLGCTVESNHILITANPIPTVTSISPSTACEGATITLSGSGLALVNSINFNGTSATTFTVVDDNTITVTVPSGATTGAINLTDDIGCPGVTDPFTVGTCGSPLTITMFINGYMDSPNTMQPKKFYSGASMNATDVEDITVTLVDVNGVPVESQTGVLQTDGTLNVSVSSTGNFWIKVTGQNLVETWSASDMPFTGGSALYDFTLNASDAFASNQIETQSGSGIWSMFNGNVVQDGAIDGGDTGQIDFDIYGGNTGYIPSDVTGDGNVDASDLGLVDFNIYYGYGPVAPF